jgi:Uncharacterized protein with conserved CXXC pairs
MDGFLSSWLQTLLQENQEVYQAPSVRCPQCQMSWQEFRTTGRLGCVGCYQAFQRGLQAIIGQLQGNHAHIGKIPKREGKGLALKREIDELKKELQGCIEKEEFEQAAQVRDRIRELESEGEEIS